MRPRDLMQLGALAALAATLPTPVRRGKGVKRRKSTKADARRKSRRAMAKASRRRNRR